MSSWEPRVERSPHMTMSYINVEKPGQKRVKQSEHSPLAKRPRTAARTTSLATKSCPEFNFRHKFSLFNARNVTPHNVLMTSAHDILITSASNNTCILITSPPYGQGSTTSKINFILFQKKLSFKVVFHTQFFFLIQLFSFLFKSNMTEFVLPMQDWSLLPFLLL